MKKYRISKGVAENLYGVCVKRYEKYYRREDGIVVDDTGSIRYIPPNHQKIEEIRKIIARFKDFPNGDDLAASNIYLNLIFNKKGEQDYERN